MSKVESQGYFDNVSLSKTLHLFNTQVDGVARIDFLTKNME